MLHQPTDVVDRTRSWIASFVIGLNLCPFAQAVFDAGTIRYVASLAKNPKELKAELTEELQSLVALSGDVRETTFLIHPYVLLDFLAYNDFLAVADEVVEELGLSGTIQIASFHPNYQFAGTAPGDAENYSNRSPYPMLHLLREESISAAAEVYGELGEIPVRNRAMLTKLGVPAIQARLKQT